VNELRVHNCTCYVLGVTLHMFGRSYVHWKDGNDHWTADRTFFDENNQIIRNRLISTFRTPLLQLVHIQNGIGRAQVTSWRCTKSTRH